MPNRTLFILAAVAGLLLLAILMLCRVDVRRAAQTGPRWRRYLVAAALLFAGWAGALPAAEPQPPAKDNGPTAKADAALEETPTWKSLAAAWREANEVASGRRGDYPFDANGKEALLASLAHAGRDVAQLREQGLLAAPEAELLTRELATVTHGVQAKRPTEMQGATCYLPMMFTPARDGLKRLQDRLPFLEQLAAGQALHATVLEKVLATVEKDLATLADEKLVANLPPPEQADARKVRAAARAAVDRIRARLLRPTGQLEQSPEWQTVVAAWQEAGPLAASGISTTAQRKEANAKLDAAQTALASLATKGLLSVPEAGLLADEAGKISHAMRREPPTDAQVVCYDRAVMPPAQQSLGSLARRLPLLKELAVSGHVHTAALQKVVPSIEADLRTLGSDAALKAFPENQRAQAEKTRADAEALLAEIKRLVGTTP